MTQVTQDTNSAIIATDYSAFTISALAYAIKRDWRNKIYFGAVPYLDAMCQMGTINDDYGCDSGVSIVLYFLANANTWRGPIAREVKKELKKRCDNACYNKPHANSTR